MAIEGVVAPPPTPMDAKGQRLDLDGVAPLVDLLVGSGVGAMFVNGTTGEGGLMSLDEREASAEAFVHHADGKAAVIVQAGTVATDESVRLADHASRIGADAVAVVAPYFFGHDQSALERHVRTIADASAVPVYLYDIPSRTQNSYGFETIRRLFEEGVVVGAKDSSGDLPRMLDMLDLPGFQLLPGADVLALTALQAGASGMVTGPGTIFPEPYVALWNAHRSEDAAAAARWQRVVVRASRALGFGADLPLLKCVLARLVPAIGNPRAPHVASPRDAVDAALGRLSAIAADAGLTAAAERFEAATS